MPVLVAALRKEVAKRVGGEDVTGTEYAQPAA
jgi:hypothetical protein